MSRVSWKHGAGAIIDTREAVRRLRLSRPDAGDRPRWLTVHSWRRAIDRVVR